MSTGAPASLSWVVKKCLKACGISFSCCLASGFGLWSPARMPIRCRLILIRSPFSRDGRQVSVKKNGSVLSFIGCYSVLIFK
ncbi:MAG: hypothetical protein LBU81_02020 [Methanosarcinales archaeon]|nr:hypothetical protein [Methanosarcinales archaeon]